jgi:predicted PurR-regulated permease PerM
MPTTHSRTRRNLILLGIVALILWFAWTVRAALNPLLIALILAYMLHPLVLSLERRGWTRKLAVNTIYGAAALLALLLTVGTYVQARRLWADLMSDEELIPRLEARLESAVESVSGLMNTLLDENETATPPAGDPAAAPNSAPAAAPASEPAQTDPAGTEAAATESAAAEPAAAPKSSVRSLIEDLRSWFASADSRSAAEQAGSLWGVARRTFGSLMGIAVLFILVPIYTWFLLFELEHIQSFVRGYMPVGERERMARIGGQIAEVLGNFFRGRLVVCLIKGLMLAALMGVLGVPYAFLLGLLSGFLSLIPFAGPAIGYGMAFLLALLEMDPLAAAWRVGVVFAVGELAEGYVLLPAILGNSLGLHPIVVFLSLTVAGAALGMFGLLLALPLAAATMILTRELLLPLLRDWAEGKQRAG